MGANTYQTSNEMAVAGDQPAATAGSSAAAAWSALAPAAPDMAYTVLNELTATSRAARPGTSAMEICQLKPMGANST